MKLNPFKKTSPQEKLLRRINEMIFRRKRTITTGLPITSSRVNHV